MRSKNSVFLCGGGALGSWQSGVLYALVKNGIIFNKVAGFSIGSINASFYCFDMLHKAERLWSLVSNNKIFKFSLSYSKPIKLFNPMNYSGLKRLLIKCENLLAGLSIYSGKRVEFLLKRYITRGMSFRKGVNFYCISYCVESSSPYIRVFNSDNYVRDDFIKNLVASSAIPFIFPAVKIKDNGRELNLVDGGVIGEGKINLDFLSGSDNIFVISNVCNKDKDFKLNRFSIVDLLDYKIRRILLYQNVLIKRAISRLVPKPNIFFITPPSPLRGRVIDFDADRCVEMFREGFSFIENNQLFFMPNP